MEFATLDAQGAPVRLGAEDLYATTTDGAPTWSRWETAPGVCRLAAVREAPCFVGALWEVPGFGRVALTAAAGGRGWQLGRPFTAGEGAAPALLPLELARTLLRRVQDRAARIRERGGVLPVEDGARLDRAIRALAEAEAATTPPAQARAAHAALAEPLGAGEGLDLAGARRAIAPIDPP